ncbi:hypothetical protein [Haloferax sp. Q22]|uniref:hypothetical protein n=1 Tax=Haloferax sp. (strain Q22) TaxID=1526048 RepID=UPI0012F9ED5E|nr:hypothetical protein [Haloferax sp. Q22]
MTEPECREVFDDFDGRLYQQSQLEGIAVRCPHCEMPTQLVSILGSRPGRCLSCGLPIEVEVQVTYPEGKSKDDSL